MDYNALVKFIRAQGCKVTVYKKKNTVDGALGYFSEDPAPHICVATKGRTKKSNTSTLLHEYGHFLQWREGFSGYFDGVCWSHNIHEEWVREKIELNDREIKMIRNVMLSIEYDAELRGYEVGMQLKPKHFNRDFHLKEAQSYMAAIKWSWKTRQDWSKRTSYRLWPAKILTMEELFSPLTSKEKKILKKMKVKKI